PSLLPDLMVPLLDNSGLSHGLNFPFGDWLLVVQSIGNVCIPRRGYVVRSSDLRDLGKHRATTQSILASGQMRENFRNHTYYIPGPDYAIQRLGMNYLILVPNVGLKNIQRASIVGIECGQCS